MEIGPRATTSGIHRTFVVTKLDLDGGDMNVTTINIRSVKLHTPEPLHHATDGYGGERDAAATMPNTGDTTITDPVSIRVFEAPAPYPLNYESFRVVVAHPMTKTPGHPLYPLTESDESVVGAVIAHMMDAFTVEMPPHPPLPRFLPLSLFLTVPQTPLPLTPIPAPRTPSPHRRPPGVRPTTRSN